MVIFSSFFIALIKLINLVLGAYMWIIIARALLSWVNPDPYNPIVRFIVQVTDPPLRYMRRYIPPISGLDLSPMILIMAILFVQTFFEQMALALGLR